MRPLTIKEQEKHAQLLGKFVEKIQKRVLSQKPFCDYQVKLKEVGYGIKVDDQYVYFDFPFDAANVPDLNDKLAHDPYLKDVDNSIHQRYFQHQKNCLDDCEYNGYIYYKYFFDKNKQEYHLLKHSNNLGIKETDENYFKFLPVMDCAASPEQATYTKPVRITDMQPFNIAAKEIIVLSKRVGKEDLANNQKPVYTDEDNMLLCTFELEATKDLDFSTLAQSLYDEVAFFLETYFHGPILEKIMLDKRKSYILGYKHNLGRLRPDLNIVLIKKYVEANSIGNIEAELAKLERIIKIYAFTHKLMFDYEFVQAGFSTYDVLFRNKSISQIIEYFNKEFGFYDLEDIFVDFKVDYMPVLDTVEGNFELFDYILILWNIWVNSQRYHSGADKIKIYSEENDLGDKSFKIINFGETKPEIIKYLNESNQSYPINFKSDNNPYPGLMIVKNLVGNNPKLSIHASTGSGQTIVQLIIKK